MSYETGTKMK